MSTLYLATGLEALADRLADLIDRQARTGDLFAPNHIVVPNRQLEKWLRLHLAERHGIAINLRVTYLEQTLWEMLRAVDPRAHAIVPEMLDADRYRLLVLAVMLGDKDPRLDSFQQYFRGEIDPRSRRSWRRAWHLADMLGNLIRDYEYHRQDALIQPWIKRIFAEQPTGDQLNEAERSQFAVFDAIVREPDGKRALLNKTTGHAYRTLPQYAMEVLEVIGTPRPADDTRATGLTLGSSLHIFGLTQISALHVSTLHWLGRFFDLHIYHLNPLVSRLPAKVTAPLLLRQAEDFRNVKLAAARNAGDKLLHTWGSAAAESLWLMTQLLRSGSARRSQTFATRGGEQAFQAEVLSARPRVGKKAPPSVLQRLQQHLLGKGTAENRLPQDTSVQIVGCPGTRREVETVYYSILHNLTQDPKLQLTDIAILVTDMNRYRPFLQAVFEQPPRRISYNLLDLSAAGLSTFGQAFLGLLDLALESFTRTRVFEVLLNPCFLARLGAERSQAVTWLRWARELGIYQGWDALEKQERGYPASASYGWQLGLQRLRLGRYMETTADNSGRPAARFGGIVPFADIDSQDREQLDAFSRAVEGLIPRLIKLRGKQATGEAWADTLRELAQAFLDVPTDRPEEAQVRTRLLASFEQLRSWDHLQNGTMLPLALIREFVQANLGAIEGRRGEYLAGGVTISALPSMRPVPMSIIYVLGLGEDIFPGSNTLPSFDLRAQGRLPGDIRPAEYTRFLFLETLLAAQQKVYLLFNNRDVQKDQLLLPAVPVVQLQRFLTEQVCAESFDIVAIPLHDREPQTLRQPAGAKYDVGSLGNETEQLLAIAEARSSGGPALTLYEEIEFKERWQRHTPSFELPANAKEKNEPAVVSLKQLHNFLRNPGLASLKRHLRLVDDEEDEDYPDDEPFVSPSLTAYRITQQVLANFIGEAAKSTPAQAMKKWPEDFDRLFEEEGLRCRVPEGGFGEAARDFMRAELADRIAPTIDEFVSQRPAHTFCGPILMGESTTPIGARTLFPALMLDLPPTSPAAKVRRARVSGSVPLAWASGTTLDILVLTTKSELEKEVLNRYLFEPVLFYLALLASEEASATSGRAWLSNRELRVYISTKKELCCFTYVATPGEARAYLQDLVTDYLDPSSFDLLPIDVIAGQKNLELAYAADQADLPQAAEYHDLLQTTLDDKRDSDFGNYWASPLVDLADLQVPPDAVSKVRKRFGLLNRGPARNKIDDASEKD